MKRILNLFCFLLFVNSFSQTTVSASGISITENYVYSRTYLTAVTASSNSAKQIESVSYFDGLGRPKQTIAIKRSPTGKDLVSDVPYDPSTGRQIDSWFPAPMSTQNGGIQSGVEGAATGAYSDSNPFSHKVLENSPLGRVNQQIDPGAAWQGKPVNFAYEVNAASDVKNFTTTTVLQNGRTNSSLTDSGFFTAATLSKNSVTDEDGNITIEFKNGEGQTILVRKVLSATENVYTYYVYNEYGQLVFVIPPLAVANPNSVLDQLCYQYRYDNKNRMVEKKLPGKGWELMVYDQQDRLVLTQDAILQTTTNNFNSKGWIFTKYDKFGRVVYTGFLQSTATRSAMQTVFNNLALNNEERTTSPSITTQGLPLYYTKNASPSGGIILLSVNYYDSYPVGTPAFNNILGQASAPLLSATYTSDGKSTKSFPLASFVKNVENDAWTKNYSFYDTKGRAFATYSFNHLGGYSKTESELDFAGIPQKSNTFHKRLSTDAEVQIKERFQYNNFNYALEKHWHQVGTNPEELLTENSYNEIGQLTSKKVGNNLQQMDYSYNIRGWLTGINNPINLGTKLFGYKINYNTVDGLQIPNTDYPLDKVMPKFNGNIAEIAWKTGSAANEPLRRYGYVYDDINRLKAGYYQNSQNASAKEYLERLEYDSNGNITKLKRSAEKLPNNTVANLIDDLTYTYTGNQLQKVADVKLNSDGYPYFATPNIMTYDVNGNMTKNADKGFSSITYNFLNLTTKVTQATGSTNYIYRADGTKLNKIIGTKSTDYLDGFQYEKIDTAEALLQFFPTAEGYYDYANSRYVYNYTDHLGNTRISFYKNTTGVATIDKESNYYPFGLEHKGYNNATGNTKYAYKYNGVELQETDLYAMEFRHYMPDIGRFTGMDALSEMYGNQTPYHFSLNNPANFSDPTGLYTVNESGDRISLDPSEFSSFQNTFKNGGSINNMFYEVQTNTNDYNNNGTLLDEVVMQGKGRSFSSNYDYNSAILHSGINNARLNHNFQQAQYTLTEAVTETEIGKSIGGVENFLFRDIPLSFAGGELLSAGWRAAGIGKYLSGGLGKIFDSGAQRVFWSGGGNPAVKKMAIEFAESHGMKTLDMTRAGINLEKLTKGLPWEGVAKPMWERLSAQFARGASNTVHVFQGSGGVDVGSVWGTVEYKILQQKGANIIYHVIP